MFLLNITNEKYLYLYFEFKFHEITYLSFNIKIYKEKLHNIIFFMEITSK